MEHSLTAEDVSKSVIDANGDYLGTVSAVEDGVALVEPAENVPPTVEIALRWTGDSRRHPLPSTSIETVTESGIYLRGSL